MKNLFDLLISNLPFICALTCFMAANVLSGVIKSRKEGTFQMAILKTGTGNYFLWLVAFSFGAVGIGLVPTLSVEINGELIEISRAFELAKTAILAFYAYKFIENILEYHNISKEEAIILKRLD